MTEVETSRAEFTEKLEARLEEARREFQKMELEQMKKGEVEARAILARAQKRFEERRATVEKELRRARKASGGAWKEIRGGLESAWDEFRSSIERARAEFEGEEFEEDEEEKSD